MIVTSYYDIYNKSGRFDQYLSWFLDLGNSGLEIILFTDPLLVSKFDFLPSSVKTVGLSLEECELYSIAMNYKGDLPSTRSPEKDTKEFLALMNTKAEFMKRAAELCVDKNLIWLDFGILKIMKDKNKVIAKLKEIASKEYSKIIIPGCWNPCIFYFDSVCWRFCGGFFILPRKDIDWFFNSSREVLKSLCATLKLTWEVNLWVVLESLGKEKIEWYHADHNDKMIMNLI